MSSNHRPRKHGNTENFWLYALAALTIGFAATTGGRAAAPKFFPDDPIQMDDDRSFDARGAQPIEGSNAYDFAENTFFKRGDRSDVRAVNVNTVDEVPDSTWFTNRIGRSPCRSRTSSADRINSTRRASTTGRSCRKRAAESRPGYRVTDPSGHLYQVKFDPPDQPRDGQRRRGHWRCHLPRARL